MVPSILPPLNQEEALETSKIYSVMGLLKPGQGLLSRRPFRAPHHTISDAGLIGGGTTPRPGEVSLAHHGVLFLDELPEFKRSTLEVLRQPLEDGVVTISRAASSITFPARFMLVAAMNPCFCGYSATLDGPAPAPPRSSAVSRPHLRAAAGPHRHPGPGGRGALPGTGRGPGGEGSAAMRTRVSQARQVQESRFARARRVFANAQMTPQLVQEHCALGPEARRLLETAVERLGLSARAYTRILKIARTIADLEGEASLTVPHVAEAIQYRSLDRQFSSPQGVKFAKEVGERYLV